MKIKSPKIKIKRVKQRQDYDCSLCCLSMITKDKYENIDKYFKHDFSEGGIIWDKILPYLSDRGFDVLIKEYHFGTNKKYIDLITKPFADVHILRVQPQVDYDTYHQVVMDSNGIIFDPSSYNSKLLNDFYEIHMNIGLFKNGT